MGVEEGRGGVCVGLLASLREAGAAFMGTHCGGGGVGQVSTRQLCLYTGVWSDGNRW